jgi:signal transduction histidine kinase
VRRGLVAVLAASGGVAAGVVSLRVVARDPALSFAGASVLGRLALVGAGWALIGSGLAFWLARPLNVVGPLLAGGGFAWFALEWANPALGSPVAFTAGLVFYALCAPIAAHAVFAFPSGHLSGRMTRAAIAVAYTGGVLVLGLLPAVFFDPARQGCSACPRNLVLVANRPSIAGHLDGVGQWAFAVSIVVLAVLAALKLVRSSAAARRGLWPVLTAGSVYLGLVAAMLVASHDRPLPWNGSLERQLWRAQALALLGLVVGVGWSWVRGRRRRAMLARLVLELAQSPPPGGLRDALAEIVGDPGLELGYPLEGTGRLVDARGHHFEPAPGMLQTSLVGGGRMLAVLAHRPGLLDDEQLVSEVSAAARLALENERLQAEARARLVELRRSRARIVEAGDAERRRLERDLHDGAQQRLVGLALSLRLLRSRLPGDADPAVEAELAAAECDVRAGIEGLRELAHGIFPAVLADGGLAAALVALAEDARVPIRLDGLSSERFPTGVEAAAYTVVAELAGAATDRLAVHASSSGGSLVLDVETQRLSGRFDRTELEDRVGAADGRLTVLRVNGAVRVRAAFPCES